MECREALLAVDHFGPGNTAADNLGNIENHGTEEMACRDVPIFLESDEATARLALDVFPQGLPLIFARPDIGPLKQGNRVTPFLFEYLVDGQCCRLHCSPELGRLNYNHRWPDVMPPVA